MKLIQKLIQIPSISGEEEALKEFIEEYLDKYEIPIIKVGNNLLACIQGNNKKKAFIFNAHMDTVSPGNLAYWNDSPYSGKLRGKKVYGLGASDEKAGIASLLPLAKKQSEQKPACDLWFQFVVNEEVDGSGTKDSLNWFMANKSKSYEDIAAVLVEPTGLEVIEIGHKGNIFIKLEVSGDSGHGSETGLIKTNSVLIMAQALIKISGLQEQWQKQFNNKILGHPTIGVGTSIHAGDIKSPNKFSDSCTATLDIRTIPEMHDQALDYIKKSVVDFPVKVSCLYDPASHGLTQKDSKLVKSLIELLPSAKLSTSKGSTDQCFFTQHAISAVIIGPGEKAVIHQPNEYCYPHKIEQAEALYNQLINDWSIT